jgi:predicted nucleic acid-binding protein
VFFDANVLVYLYSSEPQKAARARSLLASGGTVSVQVLNEFASVVHRKFKVPWDEVREALTAIRANVDVMPLTVEIHERGLAVAERYGFELFDAMLVSAALISGAGIMYSEDMQDGQVIGGVTIRNPFVDPSPSAPA